MAGEPGIVARLDPQAAWGSTGNRPQALFQVSAGGEPLALLLLVLAALTLLRLAGLAFNATDLYVDEAQYWSWSRTLDFGYYSKPPLIAWLIAGSTSLCGDGEACVRMPAAVLHSATALLVYMIGRRVLSPEVGFWAALAYATLPGVSVSAGIISTDVPLLVCWALALLAFVELVHAPRLGWAVVLGVALGLGLNAKYAMAYFVPCAAIFFLIAPEARALLLRPHLWLAMAIGLLAMVPNLMWNASHGFATLAHTADNANWQGSLFNPGKALEFIGSQFGVFGPILFGALLVIVWRLLAAWRAGSLGAIATSERLLIAFSLPIIAALTVQGLISRSLANWAAPAYVAASLLVTAVMIREGSWRWLKGSLALNAGIAVAIIVATMLAGRIDLPGAADPFARTLGNRELVAAIREGLEGNARRGVKFGAILTDDREIAAALLYYGRDLTLPVLAWREGSPRNHFELTRPYRPGSGEPVLLVSRRADASGIPERFAAAMGLGALAVPAGSAQRRAHLYELAGYKEKTP